MTEINFNKTIYFGDHCTTRSEKSLERIDDYFFLSGKKACVIANQSQEANKGAILLDQKSPWLLSCLKVISYFTVIIPVIMLIAKAALHNRHHFHLIDPKQELEKGIEISPDTWVELEEIIPLLRDGKEHPELNDTVTFFKKGPKYVFILNSTPNLVFRMDETFSKDLTFQSNSIQEMTAFIMDPYFVAKRHFNNMVKAKEISIYHGLDKLIVPGAQLHTIQNKTLIAQEYIPVGKTKEEQQAAFRQLSGSNETIRQLGVFIAKTGYEGVGPTRTPVINLPQESQEARQIALLDTSDIETFHNPTRGFFGDDSNYRPGLIKCLYSPELIDTALNVAEQYKIPFPDNLGRDIIKARRQAAIRRENPPVNVQA